MNPPPLRARLSTIWTLLAIVLSPLNAAEEPAAPSLFEGTWTWDFVMPDSSKISPTLRVQTDEDGLVSLTTRFRPGSSQAVTNFNLADRAIRFEVLRARDGLVATTVYSATLQGDTLTGTIVSEGPGARREFPWIAKRNLNVEGKWKWKLRPMPRPGSRREAPSDEDSDPVGIDMSLSLKRDADKLSGKLRIGGGSEIDIQHGKFRDGVVSFQVIRERSGATLTNTFQGRFQNDRISGSMLTHGTSRVRTNVWRAARAE